jgi:hypothetical protein
MVNAQAPVIKTQPQDGSYTVGATAALTVAAESPDGGELSYQWHRRGSAAEPWTAIGGATAASYPPPTAAAGTVFYYVRVTNTNNSVSGIKTAAANSSVATVTVTAPPTVNTQAPVIKTQPQGGSYTVGVAAALTVVAESPDGGTLSYQWHRRGSADEPWTAIGGATAASYPPPTAAAGTVFYYVRVTNTNNSVSGTKTAAANSSVATVTVTAPPTVNTQAPVITAQPQGGSYTVGATAAALTVAAESPDGGDLSYQWHRRGSADEPWTAIGGATAASYPPPTAAAGTVFYYARVTNTNNSVSGIKTAAVNSSVATITVTITETVVNAQAPVIKTQPQGGSYTVGAAAALTVAAESPDGGELSYQWHRRGSADEPWTAIGGATAASYPPPTAAAGTVYYYVRVTNTNNSVSGTKTAVTNSAAVTVTVTVVNAQAPVITAQPQGGSYAVGATAAPLTVTATSPDGGVLSYQWHKAEGNAWAPIEGATGPSYTPPTAAAGAYYVEVTNTNNSVSGAKTATTNSDPAVVTVTGAQDIGLGKWTPYDDYGLITMTMTKGEPGDPEVDIVISIEEGGILTFTAADGLENLRWSLNGEDVPGPRGGAQSIVIEAAKYVVGNYTLGLYAEKAGIPYSINIPFVVDN